jgi:hypothetical protein
MDESLDASLLQMCSRIDDTLKDSPEPAAVATQGRHRTKLADADAGAGFRN